jgi:hypothetical protein
VDVSDSRIRFSAARSGSFQAVCVFMEPNLMGVRPSRHYNGPRIVEDARCVFIAPGVGHGLSKRSRSGSQPSHLRLPCPNRLRCLDSRVHR